MATKTVDLPVMHARAAFEPSTFNEEARTVELVWTTGASVRRSSWLDGDYMEELSTEPAHVRLERLNAGAPLLDSHNRYSLRSIVGVVERAWMESGEGRAIVRFSDRDDVADIVADVKSGVIRNISVGYRIHKYEVDEVDESDSKLPTYRAIDWEPMEVSLVSIPADAGAQIRSDAETYPVVIHRATQAHDEEAGAMSEKATEKVRKEQPAPEQVNTDQIRSEAVEAERKRVRSINEMCRKAGLSDEFGQRLIDEGVELDAARAAVIDELATVSERSASDAHRGMHIDVGETDSEKFVRGASDAIIARAGHGQQDAGSEFRGLRLLDLARMSLERSGVRTMGLDVRDLVGRAFTQGSSDFPILLENAMHKALQAAYRTQPDTWSRFCATGSVSDFRAHNRYRLGSFGNLDAKTELGEFKNKAIPDGEKASIQAGTKGNIINLSREAIINDDLGAFVGLAAMLGQAGRRTIESDVYALLALNGGLGPNMADGKSLFHADHGNLGAGSALSVEGLDGDRVKMAQQKDVSGNDFLDLRPAVLLVPIGLGGTARVINGAEYDPDTSGKLQKPNKVRGLVGDIVDSPRLSGTRRYLFADPSEAPVIEVVFLDGMQEPYLEMQQGFDVDGSRWKVRLDYGVGAIDFRGAVTNAGAE